MSHNDIASWVLCGVVLSQWISRQEPWIAGACNVIIIIGILALKYGWVTL